jgi:hypothetical protein
MAVALDIAGYAEANELYWTLKCLLLHNVLYPLFSLIWCLSPRRALATIHHAAAHPDDHHQQPAKAVEDHRPVIALGPDPDGRLAHAVRLALGLPPDAATSYRRPDLVARLLARKLACRLPGQLYAPLLPGPAAELRAALDRALGPRTPLVAGQLAAALAPELARAFPAARVVLYRPAAAAAAAAPADWGAREARAARRWAPWLLRLASCRRFWAGQVEGLLWRAQFCGDGQAGRDRWLEGHGRAVEGVLEWCDVLEWCEEDGM